MVGWVGTWLGCALAGEVPTDPSMAPLAPASPSDRPTAASDPSAEPSDSPSDPADPPSDPADPPSTPALPAASVVPAEAPPAPPAPASDVQPLAAGRITGRIREFGSGAPVTPTLSVGGQPVAVGADGRFVAPVAAGAVVIEATSDQHQTWRSEHVVGPGEELGVELLLRRFSWDEAIIVYDEGERVEVSRKVLSAEELRLVPGAFGDPLRALQSLPGVARPNFLEGTIVVRGAEGVNTATYIDEVPVPYLFHWFVGSSVINPSLLDDIEFYPGGMPSRFGDSTQAVVNARLQTKPPKPGLHGRFDISTGDVSASLETPIANWDVEVGGRYSVLGGLIAAGTQIAAAVRGEDPSQATWVAPWYFDYAARATGRITDKDTLKIAAFGSRDVLTLRIPEDDFDSIRDELPYDPGKLIDSTFHRLQIRWDRKDGAWTSSTWIAGGYEQQVNVIPGIGQFFDVPSNTRLSGWSAILRREDRFPLRWPGGRLQTGLDFRILPTKVENLGDLQPDFTVPATEDVPWRASGWAELHQDIGNTWLAPGIRLQVHRFDDRTWFAPEPRLSWRHRADPRWTVTAFAGRFTQMPPPERYAAALGNARQPLMDAWQGSVGLEGRWPSGIEVDASIYATSFGNLLVQDWRLDVDEGAVNPDGSAAEAATAQVITTYYPVRGYAFGAEAMIRWRPNNGFFGWIGLTASKALRVEDGRTFPGDYDQPLAGVVVAGYRAPKEWRFSGRFRATSGQPYTPMLGVYRPDNGDWAGMRGEVNSARFPIFHQLDLRIDKTWVRPRARWTTYLDIANVTSARNPIFATYTPNYTEFVPLLTLPILPTLGLEITY